MRLVVMSDSHRDVAAVEAVLAAEPGADGFFHLGDGYRDWALLKPASGQFIMGVAGNCDYGTTAGSEWLGPLGGVKVFACHGDRYRVKQGLSELKRAAAAKGAQVVLYGHTHVASIRFEDGLWLICPGALSGPKRQYAVLELSGGAVRPALKLL